MADKDITIGFQTVGADKASAEANKLVKSLFGVQDAAQKAQSDLDVLEAKQRVDARGTGDSGGIGEIPTGATKGLAQAAAQYAGFGEEFSVISKLLSADAAVAASSFVAVGAAVAKSYQLLDETATRWREFESELKAKGEEIPQDIANQIQAIEETIAPVRAVISGVTDAMGSMWAMVKDPVGELTGLNMLKESMAQQEEQLKRLNALRRSIAEERGATLAGVYKAEAEGLKEQEETLRRIAVLRGQLQSIEQQRADRQVKIAQQDGGDVALAEINAQAVRLKVEIAKITENLRMAEAETSSAQQAYDAAFSAYNRAIVDNTDKLDPEKFSKLSKTLDDANKELQKSQSIANEQARLFADAKANVVEDVEVALIDLQDRYKGVWSSEASSAFAGMTETMRQTLASGPQAAIAQIQVEAGAITTAANERAAEVQQGLSTERAGTVQAIEKLAPTPQDTQAITTAVQSVGKAIQDQGNATISALGAVAAGIGQVTNAIARQQSQINQLFARIR